MLNHIRFLNRALVIIGVVLLTVYFFYGMRFVNPHDPASILLIDNIVAIMFGYVCFTFLLSLVFVLSAALSNNQASFQKIDSFLVIISFLMPIAWFILTPAIVCVVCV